MNSIGHKIKSGCIVLISVLLLSQCKNEMDVKITDANIPEDISDYPAIKKLSEYKMFKFPLASMQPEESVIPYDLNSSLFTDYAFKKRFIFLPKGTAMDYHATETFDFPVGSMIFKFFYYPSDFSQPEKNIKIIETRVLLKHEQNWQALTYIWNDEQSDAVLSLAGDYTVVNWIDESGKSFRLKYSVPGILQCKSCHEYNGKINPIGPAARHMNKLYSFQNGSINQLEYFKNQNKLNHLPSKENILSNASWENIHEDVSARSRAYLDINCSFCHRKEGPARNSGLYLTSFEQNESVLGIYKSPVAAGRGSGRLKYDILPGKPESSILVYRMKSLEPGIMMPELGKRTIHAEGVALISDWIQKMEN